MAAGGTIGDAQFLLRLCAVSTNGEWVSALTDAEWSALATYESDFNVRQIDWYAYASSDLGFNNNNVAVDTSINPINATVTAAGQAIFPYVPAGGSISISSVFQGSLSPVHTAARVVIGNPSLRLQRSNSHPQYRPPPGWGQPGPAVRSARARPPGVRRYGRQP